MVKINFDEPSVVEFAAEGGKRALEIRNAGQQGDAIWGVALKEKGVGVTGVSDNWMAVVGMTKKHQGVHGMVSESGFGVVGSTNGAKGSGAGVWGVGNNAIGVMGESKLDRGVVGTSDKDRGVAGFSTEDAGVFGNSVKWYGVYGFAHQDQIGGVLAEGGKHALVSRNGVQSVGRFEGNVEVTGDIKLVNADCAEDFDVADSESNENIEAGTVMVLTENGSLRSSYQEYDKKVAGIVSGASGYKPAIVLDRQQVQDHDKKNKNKDRLPVALVGKVYCKVDARYSSIEIGDLLTTSSTKGYAMKAADPMKAFGAVIGKALGSIKEGLGMIPVLVALQ